MEQPVKQPGEQPQAATEWKDTDFDERLKKFFTFMSFILSFLQLASGQTKTKGEDKIRRL